MQHFKNKKKFTSYRCKKTTPLQGSGFLEKKNIDERYSATASSLASFAAAAAAASAAAC